jgi:hypothetical protein
MTMSWCINAKMGRPRTPLIPVSGVALFVAEF